jgi:hypothetical protein
MFLFTKEEVKHAFKSCSHVKERKRYREKLYQGDLPGNILEKKPLKIAKIKNNIGSNFSP